MASNIRDTYRLAFLLGRMVGRPRDATKVELFAKFLPDQRNNAFHLGKPAHGCLEKVYDKLRNDKAYTFGELFYDLVQLGRRGHDFGASAMVTHAGWWGECQVRFGKDEIVKFRPSRAQEDMFDNPTISGLRLTQTTSCEARHFIAAGQALGAVVEERKAA